MLARKMSGAHREAARLKLALDKAVAQSLWSTASDLLDVIAALSVNRELLGQTEIGLSYRRLALGQLLASTPRSALS